MRKPATARRKPVPLTAIDPGAISPAVRDAERLYTERLIATAMPRREIVRILQEKLSLHEQAAQTLLRETIRAMAEDEATLDREQRRTVLRRQLERHMFEAGRAGARGDVVRVARLIAEIDGLLAPRKVELTGKVEHGVDHDSVREAFRRKALRDRGVDPETVIDVGAAE